MKPLRKEIMDESLKIVTKNVHAFLQTRTGIFGWGPTYGQIILCHVVDYAMRRYEERGIVREAEKVLEEINTRNHNTF
jgi:hypothetical protein